MKKLLSLLAAFILLGAMTVDTSAATIYVHDDGNSFINLWWWGGSDSAEGAGYKFPGPNLVEVATKVNGSDGKSYYTYEISDGTTGVILTHNSGDRKELNNLTTSDFDYVFSVSGGKTDTTVASVTGGGSGSEEKTYTVHYQNGDYNWDEVFGFWKYGNTDGNTWPGTKLEKINGVYTFTFTTDQTPTTVIFNNGNTGTGNQTENYTFEDGKTYGSPEETPVVDYSKYSVRLRYEGHWNADYFTANLEKDGTVTFSIDLGNQGGFNFQVSDGSKTYHYNGDTSLKLDNEFTLTSGSSEAYFAINDSNYDKSKETTITFDFVNNKMTLSQSAPTEPDYTVYYDNSKTNWNKVYAFWEYEDNGKLVDGCGWTANELSNPVNGVYTFSFDTDKTPKVIIFNNGGTGDGNQTSDFEFVNGKTYTFGEDTPLPTDPTVYFICPSAWSQPKIYYFNNLTGASSGNFGDLALTQEAPAALQDLVDLEEGEKLYQYTFDLEKYPEVIFNNAGSSSAQTRNLAAVDGGIYRYNNVLLPSMRYKDGELEVYSTAADVLKYNSIYVCLANPPQETATEDDEDEFFAFNKCSVGDAQSKRIAIDITYTPEGGSPVTVTGNRGTSWMYVREIAGKKFFRIDFAESLIPNNTTLDKIDIYECDYSVSASDAAARYPNASSNEDDMKKAGWSFSYENVLYSNGRVFYRPPFNDEKITHITELFSPEYLQVQAMGDGFTFTDNTDRTITLKAGERYDMIESQNANEKLTYNLHKVTKDSRFNIVAGFINGDGGISEYVFADSEEALRNLIPNNDYTFETLDVANADNHYGIEYSKYPAVELYDVTVRWADQVLFVSPVKVTADFVYRSLPDAEGDGDLYIYNRRIDASPSEVVLSDNPADLAHPVYIAHHEGFGVDNAHYDAMVTAMEPRSEYVTAIGGSNYGGKASALEAHETGLSKVNIAAHTAGIYNLYVAQTKVLDDFHQTSIRIPVRVMPTIQSLGLALNYFGIYEEDGMLKCTPNHEYSFSELGFEWNAQKVKFSAMDANDTDLEVWFKPVESSDNTNNALYAPSVVRRAESSLTDAVDVEGNPDPAELGYTKYSNKNTLSLVDADGNAKPQQVSFIVKQNGILGKAQTVFIDPTDENLPTGVEEIKGADECAPVYYDLNGVRVNGENLQPGIYIVVKGENVSKVLVK